MSSTHPTLVSEGALHLDLLQQLCQRPAPFAPGEELFWDDPHISQQMLAAHLDPHTDAASRRPEVIDQTVDWLVSFLGLASRATLLDLGCGPGLYCERFSRHGLVVTGIDYARTSIAYAIAHAAEHGLAIQYVRGNYLHTPFPGEFDVIVMIYGDLCVLPPAQRDTLLGKVHAALREGGHFVCDVTTRRHRQRVGLRSSWSVHARGFWQPVPHLVLMQGFDYPEQDLYLDQYIVVTEDGQIAIYRNWFQDYSLDTITSVLATHGFAVKAAWSDLAGAPYDAQSEWIGIVAHMG
jgi:SAM-dependent methyltransferase